MSKELSIVILVSEDGKVTKSINTNMSSDEALRHTVSIQHDILTAIAKRPTDSSEAQETAAPSTVTEVQDTTPTA